MTPATEDLRAYRWTQFKELFPIEGIDLTGASFAMQVRQYPDATGDPLISLTDATSPAQGISLSVATVGGLPTSTIEVRINETTIEGLYPFPANGLEPGQEVKLAYDMHITLSSLGKRRWFQGVFIIVPGVTQ